MSKGWGGDNHGFPLLPFPLKGSALVTPTRVEYQMAYSTTANIEVRRAPGPGGRPGEARGWTFQTKIRKPRFPGRETAPRSLQASLWQRGTGSALIGRRPRAAPAGRRRLRPCSGRLNLAVLMQAAGPWRAVSPVPCTRFVARCRPGPRPSSSFVTDLIADSQGPGLEEVVVTECLSPLPLSCSNSTLSLLSPLGHQSFPFGEDDSEGEEEEAVDEDARESEAKVESLEGTELPGHSR